MEIAVIGLGNVGTHMARALSQSDQIIVKGISSRTLEGLSGKEVLWLLTVADSAIQVVAEKLCKVFPSYSGIVGHTAGSVGLDALSPYFKRRAVFYPLQTFSKNIEIADYSNIPVFIEAEHKDDETTLIRLAEKSFRKVYVYSEDLRKYLHLMGVFACNFTNALFAAAEEIGLRQGIPFEILYPLIEQTVTKVKTHSPSECQTGPAVRGDSVTMARHLSLLADDSYEKELYTLISQYIKNKNKI